MPVAQSAWCLALTLAIAGCGSRPAPIAAPVEVAHDGASAQSEPAEPAKPAKVIPQGGTPIFMEPVTITEMYPYLVVVFPRGVLGDPPPAAGENEEACWINLANHAPYTGSLELCPGYKRDASALIGKRARLTLIGGHVQSRNCEGDLACPDGDRSSNRDVWLVQAIMEATEPAPSTK